MTIEPVKIPQNVYVEDRIIGPITLRQIMIILISGGISYAFWAIMQAQHGADNPLVTILAWFPTAIGVLYAFVKINGISMFRITLLALERLDKPPRRTWSPRKGIYVNIVTKGPARDGNEELQKKLQEKGKTKIDELSEVLDQGPEETEDEAGEQTIVLAEETTTDAVERETPDNVQVEPLTNSVDSITPTKQPPEQSTRGGLLHDIIPPQPQHG